MEEKKIPVIIDTDPGVDDALAIMIAAASEKIDLLGLTPVDGNVSAVHTHRNALNLVSFLKLDADVAEGGYDQLVYRYGRYAKAHGATGMGGVELPVSDKKFHPLRAWDYIYEKAKEHPGELVIIAIGPLTNIARLLIMHPDVKPMIKQIVMMGGSTTEGNVTPYAEFNYIVDPPAAKMVFESGIPLVMAGLNVTLKTGISFDFIANLARESGSKIGGMLDELVHGYSDVKVNKEGEKASVVHDAIAVAYVIDPSKCETEEDRIEIQADRFMEGTWGQSKVVDGTPNCTVITDIDMDFYRDLYRRTVEHFGDLA